MPENDDWNLSKQVVSGHVLFCGRRQEEEVEETPQFVFLVKVASTPGLQKTIFAVGMVRRYHKTRLYQAIL